MFLIFNRQKIVSYFIAFGTVAFLFIIALVTTNPQNTIETSTTLEEPISYITTEESYQANNEINMNHI